MKALGANRGSYFMLAILILIAVAFAATYYRYIVTLEYPITFYLDCDPTVDVCVTDEESYYAKYSALAATLEQACPGEQDDACIHALEAEGAATMLNCEEYLEEGESCTSPEDFIVAESVAVDETSGEEAVDEE